MTAASQSSPDEDRAWATIHTTLRPEELSDLSRDVEVLFRLNPYYYFNVWRQTGPDTFHVEFENKSNQLRQSLDLHVAHEDGRGLTVAYSGGIKKYTAFTIEPATGGSRLTVTDDYNLLPVAEREQRQAEVDKSLKAWAESLRLYFVRLKRWSWLPGWRWYMRRVWIPMKPSARRIVWFIYLITVAEFFFFLFVLLIYLIEQNN
ncbi:MAG: hypothetical protein NUV55_08705 [Sulfuricaulis sp.]|uniref:hypothetical protein n=1 Tax=Sulfuricaulis sp. TaxID=2003553 RepID=UPI0026006E2F|nr:hypothetical protein [Sulfuricaulis sp.]MCR4347262.1 hypothetical protein [Sulfuricaulis sp.]